MCHIQIFEWTCGHTKTDIVHCTIANQLDPDPVRCQNPTRNKDKIRLDGVCDTCWEEQNPDQTKKKEREAKRKEDEEKERQKRLEEWEKFLPDDETVVEEDGFLVTAGSDSIPEDANVGKARGWWFWPFGAKAKS